MPDDIELDLSDLMAQDANPAPDATAATDPEAQPAEGDTAPSTTPASDPKDAEIAQLKQHVDNLLSKLSANPQQGTQQPQADTLPSIDEVLTGKFDAPTINGLKAFADFIEKRTEAKFKNVVPRAEWDAAQPVLQQAVLTLDEQRTQQSFRQRGVTEAQLQSAQAEMNKMIKNGARFSSYDAGYSAGLGVAFLAEKQAAAKGTKIAREEKEARAAQNNNTPASTPATRPGTLKLAKETLLNNPLDALDAIKAAGVK